MALKSSLPWTRTDLSRRRSSPCPGAVALGTSAKIVRRKSDRVVSKLPSSEIEKAKGAEPGLLMPCSLVGAFISRPCTRPLSPTDYEPCYFRRDRFMRCASDSMFLDIPFLSLGLVVKRLWRTAVEMFAVTFVMCWIHGGLTEWTVGGCSIWPRI